MDTQDFRRCYSCKAIMPQRSGGLCPLCNPRPDPEPSPDDEDEEDYDWTSKSIDYRGPEEEEDWEDNGEPILGSYVLCHSRPGEASPPSPCIACQGLPSECIPCGCPEVQRSTIPDH